MRCFKGCFGSKETKKLLQNQHQQPLLSCNKEEEEEIFEPVKEIAVLRSEIKSKEKINSPSEIKPTRACVDDDENLMENEKPEIKNKNREENDKEEDDNGGGMLHSISNEINTSSKNDPNNLLQERITGDQKTTSTDSTESLFSLSIDSRKQFWTITEEQQGDNKEVNSRPLKDITSRVEPYDENHLHFAGQRVEVRNDGKKKPSICHEHDKENMKSNEIRIKLTMKEKNSIDLQKLKPLSGTKENVIDTASFSSWLGGGGSSEKNASLKRSRSNNANNSPESEKNYDVKGGSMKVEHKEFKESVESTPSCSVGDDGDEWYIDGTIGRYLQTKKRFKTSIASVQM